MAFEKFLAYSASAGSGKTYALSVRYIALLFLGESPKSILAATFTKKAANEMNERIISFLQNLPKDKQLLESVSLASGLEPNDILKRQKEVLERFVKEKNYIVTLDSFFNAILRSFALEIGLDPAFLIKENIHQDLEEHFISTLEKESSIGSLVELSFILEKRRSNDLMELFKSLFEIEPTLPQKEYKAYELASKKAQIQKKKEEFLAKLQALDAPKRVVKLFEEEDFKKFISKGFFDYETLAEHPWFKKLYQKDSSIDNYFFELKALIKEYFLSYEESILYYLFKLYESYKSVRLSECRGKNTLSFSDVLYYTYVLLNQKVSKDFIYFRLDSKFKHMLLDEFQDTSSLQYLILEPLIEEIFSGVGVSDFRSFFYVGDTKQSLYRFRGGVEGLFGYLAKRFRIPIKHLDTNYRSAKNIVAFTNRVFLESEISDFVPQKAHSDIEGYVEVIKSEELLEKAKEKVLFYLEAGADINDIALLVFANKDGVALQEYLKEQGINSILKTASSLKDNPKIAALVGVLYYLLRKKEIYLAPFKAKIQKEQIDLSFVEGLFDPFEILDKLISHFAYCDNDANILKLLDFAANFNTIEEFLDEFEKSNIPLAQQSSEGVEIMTIHGSKGLEFKYVIVLDRLGGGSNSKDLLLFEEQSPIAIKKIHTRQSKKENFVESYKRALQKESQLERKDKLNLLYVAITRAELALSLLLKPSKSEFDILSLEEETIGKLFIQKSKVKESAQKLTLMPHFYGKQELKLQEQEKSSVKDFDKIYFGEALHYALEMLSFFNPDYERLKQTLFNSYGELLSTQEIKSIIKRIQNLLAKEEFQAIIAEATLLKEQTISYNGSIYQLDLLVQKADCTIVCDYKSSQKFHFKHTKQLQEYKEALNAIKSTPIKAYIIYLLEDGVEIIKM